MRELDHMATLVVRDEQELERFITQNEFFILKCASAVAHRYITKSDDEWSLSLLAFTQAIQTYDLQKGSFLSFAEMVIRRRLIDYYRTQNKYQAEIAVDPHTFATDPKDDETDAGLRMAVAKQLVLQGTNSLKDEIEAASLAFSPYGFTFFDLADSSPKAEKTKTACAIAVAYMLQNPPLKQELYRSRQLPIKIIEKNTHIPRKILERHRKYIIAAVEICSGEYPGLAEYMRYIRKELNK